MPGCPRGSVVLFAHLPSQVELEGPVLGARYVDVIDGCPVLCPAALGGPFRGGNGKFASQVKLQGAVLGRGYVEGGRGGNCPLALPGEAPGSCA